jgi:multidrug efflux pump subunit AcrB
MSFGASQPIAVRVIGTNYGLVRQHAEAIAAQMKKVAHLRDVGFQQTLDYPTVEIDIDRELAGLIGVTPMHAKHALVMATSSTRFTDLNYWIDVRTGFDYLVQIQVPPLNMDEPSDLEELPLQSVNPRVPLMVRDILKDGRVHTSMRPGEFDGDMSQR